MHQLGPGGPGETYRWRVPLCPVDFMEKHPEVGDAVEQFTISENLGLPLLTGALGEQDVRKVTLWSAIASEVPWVHAAMRRASEEKRG
jgi:hypothetical protein